MLNPGFLFLLIFVGAPLIELYLLIEVGSVIGALPTILLSGFMFPYRGMPDWAQVLGEVFPLTHFLRMIRGVMLKGSDLDNVAGPMMAMVAFVLAFAALALLRRAVAKLIRYHAD